MSIPEDLKKLVRHGDHSLIAEMYAEIHSQGSDPDYKTVSPEYVRLILAGSREINPGTAAEEVARIAVKYLEHKRDFIDEILTA